MTSRRPLTDAEVDQALAALPGWRRVGSGASAAIEKSFPFPNYEATIAFVNAVAGVANAQDHHPEMSVHYGRCVVRYSTHDARAVTAVDLDAARRIEAIPR